jgi:hypothetical protein
MLCEGYQTETLRESGSYGSDWLVLCSTIHDDHRTSGQSKPNDEEHGKHRTCSNGDSLQKTENEETHAH